MHSQHWCYHLYSSACIVNRFTQLVSVAVHFIILHYISQIHCTSSHARLLGHPLITLTSTGCWVWMNAPQLLPWLSHQNYKLYPSAWDAMPRGHLNVSFAINYSTYPQRHQLGFRIGFNHSKDTPWPARKNIGDEHSEVIDAYLRNKVPSTALFTYHLPFSLKMQKPGKWRLIIDLSSPESHSR